jgi:site-specific recombinase XerD
MVEEVFLERRPTAEITGTPLPDPALGVISSGYGDKPSTSTSPGPITPVMDNFGWAELVSGWSVEDRSLLTSGWRPSTLKTYRPAWDKWKTWCRDNTISYNTPEPIEVARYLGHLYNKEGLSYNTILVHKSAIATFCKPMISKDISSNIVVRHMLKAISTRKTRPTKPPIWDPRIIVDYLKKTTPLVYNLYEVSRRTAILLLLASGRRVHDLTLLSVADNGLVDNGDHIILWPVFGSKTDTSRHRQSGWKLSASSCQNIDPVFWLRKLICVSNERREEGGNIPTLFISSRGPPKPATRAVIGNWVKSVLADAGVQESPGSTRSAVASLNWLENYPIDDILQRGNWRQEATFKTFYQRPIDTQTSTAGEQNMLTSLFSPVH